MLSRSGDGIDCVSGGFDGIDQGKTETIDFEKKIFRNA
jgi:hypothetical protein